MRGLFVNSDALPKLAWLEYLSGNPEDAVDLLGTAAEHQRGQGQGPEPLLPRRHPEPPGAPPGSAHQSRSGPGRAIRPGPRARGERRIAVAARSPAGGRLGLDGCRLEQCRPRPGEQPARRRRRGRWAGPKRRSPMRGEPTSPLPTDPFFHWMVGLRLQGVGMARLAEKHFRRAIELDPGFRSRLEKAAS